MSNVQTTERSVLEKPKFKDQYENYIGGKWTPPTKENSLTTFPQ